MDNSLILNHPLKFSGVHEVKHHNGVPYFYFDCRSFKKFAHIYNTMADTIIQSLVDMNVDPVSLRGVSIPAQKCNVRIPMCRTFDGTPITQMLVCYTTIDSDISRARWLLRQRRNFKNDRKKPPVKIFVSGELFRGITSASEASKKLDDFIVSMKLLYGGDERLVEFGPNISYLR